MSAGSLHHQPALAALAETNRARIVELLASGPRPVGEIAATLGLRQPQTTKHLQALERAGLVEMHPLGQRRIYAVRPDALRPLLEWLHGVADAAAVATAADGDALAAYQAAIAAEQQRLRTAAGESTHRQLRFARQLAAAPAAVWEHWTDPHLIAHWWSPRHFAVHDAEAEPVPGGALRLVLREGDGTLYTSAGRYLELDPPARLSFSLAPLGPDERPLFDGLHRVRLAEVDAGTHLALQIDVYAQRPEAAAALAGMELGWGQSLDRLEAALAR